MLLSITITATAPACSTFTALLTKEQSLQIIWKIEPFLHLIKTLITEKPAFQDAQMSASA